MTTCIIRGCDSTATTEMGVDLGPTWDESTTIAESARHHVIHVCAEHSPSNDVRDFSVGGYATGGWVGLNGPTGLIVGESGPEYIVPLRKKVDTRA